MKIKKLFNRIASSLVALGLVVGMAAPTLMPLGAYGADPGMPPNNPTTNVVGDKYRPIYITLNLDSENGEDLTPVKEGVSPKIYKGDNLVLRAYDSVTGSSLMTNAGEISSILPNEGFVFDGPNKWDFLVINKAGEYSLQFGRYVNTSLKYSGTIKINVEDEVRQVDTAVTGISMSPSTSVTVAPNSTKQFTGSVTPSDATDKSVTYAVVPVNGNVNGTIDANGLFTATGTGLSDVTVTSADGNFTATCRVTVGNTATNMEFDPSSITLAPGDSTKVKVNVTPEDSIGTPKFMANNLNLSTSYNAETKELTVKANTSTASNNGFTSYVTGTLGTATGQLDVTVKKPVDPSVVASITASDFNLYIGESKILRPTVLPQTATDKSLKFESMNPQYVTVDSNGKFTGIAEGTSDVLITSVSNPDVSVVITVTVSRQKVPVDLTLDYDTTPTNDIVGIVAEATRDVDYIILPNGNIIDSNVVAYNVSTNGTYSFTAVGDGVRVTKIAKVSCIDTAPPIITFDSTASIDSTTYSVNGVDYGSGMEYLQLPGGQQVTSYPALHEQTTFGQVSFIAVDKAHNIATSTAQRSAIRVGDSTSETLFSYEGVPENWTNKSVELKATALNMVDGAAVGIDKEFLGDIKKVAVKDTKMIHQNTIVNIKVQDGLGNTQEVPVEINKIDKDMPVCEITYSEGKLNITANDSLSGIKRIVTPDGSIGSSTSRSSARATDVASYTPAYNGTYQFQIEDHAGNVTTAEYEVTGLVDPVEPIVPPDTVTTLEDSDVNVIGTVYPESSSDEGLLSIVVPTDMEFIIDEDRNFLSPNYTFKNTGINNASISVVGVTPKQGTTVELVAPDTYSDWTTISNAETISKMGLTLNDVSLHLTNTSLLSLTPDSEKSYRLVGYYGHDWGNSDNIVVQYNMTLEIELNAVGVN